VPVLEFALPQAKRDALRRRNTGRAVVVGGLVIFWGLSLVLAIRGLESGGLTTLTAIAVVAFVLIPVLLVVMNYRQERLTRNRIPSRVSATESDVRLFFEDGSVEVRSWGGLGPTLSLIRTQRRTDGLPGVYLQVGGSNWTYAEPPTFEALSHLARASGTVLSSRKGSDSDWVQELTTYGPRTGGRPPQSQAEP
jgi:hypothetical protein